ncbi:MAG: hypothetical protein ABW139_02780 [Candidatus Thiodiazotropha sp. DIVDIV]
MSRLIAYKSRGDHKGKPIYPHKHKDGTFVASPSRFDVDYIHVETEEELEALVRSGLGARMSSPEIKQAASLIISEQIEFTDTETTAVTVKVLLPKLIEEIELDVVSTSRARKEQAFLRAFHQNGQLNSKCVLCGEEYPLEFLVAAHIKKRTECSDTEKLDFENVAALMCKAGCDDLFEKGYVYVSAGEVCKNTKRNTTPAMDSVIDRIVGNMVSNWHGSKVYYKYHEKKFNK